MADTPDISDNAADITGAHPRDIAVEAAGREIHTFMLDWVKRHALTAWELSFILNSINGRHVQRMCILERTPPG